MFIIDTLHKFIMIIVLLVQLCAYALVPLHCGSKHGKPNRLLSCSPGDSSGADLGGGYRGCAPRPPSKMKLSSSYIRILFFYLTVSEVIPYRCTPS